MKKIIRNLFNRIAPNANNNLLVRKQSPANYRFEVDNWAVSDCIVKRIVPVVGVHPYPLTELQLMVSAFCYVQPKYVFDWGTHIGKSARIFSEAAQWFSIPTHIHTIDLPPEVNHQEHPHEHVGKLIRKRSDVTQHFGDGIQVARDILSKSRDSIPACLFFVDGDHSFASVQRELNEIRTIAPNAYILLHDTLFQVEESGYNVGPAIAIEEFLQSNQGQYYRIDMATGLPGMTLLCPQQPRT